MSKTEWRRLALALLSTVALLIASTPFALAAVALPSAILLLTALWMVMWGWGFFALFNWLDRTVPGYRLG